MAKHPNVKFVVLAVHFLATCPGCGLVISVLRKPRGGHIDCRPPECRRCRIQLSEIEGTTHAELLLKGG